MRRSLLALLTACAVSCRGGSSSARDEDIPAPERVERHEPARPSAHPERLDQARSDYLAGALMEASYDPSSVARWLAALPRPTPTESSLVALAGGLIDAFVRDPADELERLGLRADARIRVSARALDGRFAAVAKRLGELSGDGGGAPEQLASLASEARSLGLHVRASVPTTDARRLLGVLGRVTQTERSDGPSPAARWAEACAGLEGVKLCAGWPQLLVWARAHTDGEGREALRVDAVYLFHDGAELAELERALARADGWDSQPLERAPLDERADMQLALHAEGMLALLRAEALSDAAEAFTRAPSREPYASYLDRERALRELYAPSRLFEGVALELDYEAQRDALEVSMRWLAHAGSEALRAELFAPAPTRPGMPLLVGECARALACGRFGGLSSVLRYAPLAEGAFSDLTGATRVLRQAGDRGMIMLLLGAWPQLLGTGAAMAEGGRGMVAKAQASVLRDSDGLGFVAHSLGEGERERWAGYLRVSREAMDPLRSAIALVGSTPTSVELSGVELPVERGSYEDTQLYLVEEEESGWVVAASDEGDLRALVTSAREIDEQLEPLWYLRIASLGEVAAHEQLSYSEDPPVRAWLDAHALELEGELTPSGPQLRIRLSAREP